MVNHEAFKAIYNHCTDNEVIQISLPFITNETVLL